MLHSSTADAEIRAHKLLLTQKSLTKIVSTNPEIINATHVASDSEIDSGDEVISNFTLSFN
jgi:hypothetical protein